MQIRQSVNQIRPSIFALNSKSAAGKNVLITRKVQNPGPKKQMNPQSAAIVGSGNPLKSRFEAEIRAKIFSKSADPFSYSARSLGKISVYLYEDSTGSCHLCIIQCMEQCRNLTLTGDEIKSLHLNRFLRRFYVNSSVIFW